MHCSRERVAVVVVSISGKSVIAVGARCTDVRANELLVVRGCCVYRTWNSARCYMVRHICSHLVVMDRVDQPMSVALGCAIINWLAATISVYICGVRVRIFHELELVFNALVLCLRGTETLMHSSFILVESRAIDR